MYEFFTYFNPGFESVYSGLVENSYNLVEILDSFFDVAKKQNWVKPSDILHLQQEYRNIKKALPNFLKENLEEQGLKEQPSFVQATEEQGEKEEIIETASDPIQLTQGISSVPLPKSLVMPKPSVMEESNVEVSERQKIILDILKQKEGIQVWEIKDIMRKNSPVVDFVVSHPGHRRADFCN